MKTNTFNDFNKIVIEEIPLIDVRAPIEFEKGAFINTVNLPLMNDEERHLVGICYKEKGNEEAVKLGHQLVSGDIRQARIEAWKSRLEQYPNSMIYCFRGGLRSKLSQQWLLDSIGKNIPRLEGGYKAFRNYLINALNPSELKSIPIILGGCTGSGKTIILKKLKNVIDLEGIANHRGSSFGGFITPQPSQIDFENNLAYALIQHEHKGYTHMILEDEGRNVGRCFIPQPLREHFNQGDLVLLEQPLEKRIETTINEYVIQSQGMYVEVFGKEQGFHEWSNYIISSINKLKKRLGGDRYKKLIETFELSFKEQIQSGSFHPHRYWIKILLQDYYDPMYQYQIQNTSKKIIFTGNAEEVLAYLKTV